MPDTDFGFMLELFDDHYIKLRYMDTGKRGNLIKGSTGTSYTIQGAFFLKCSGGYELHFCTLTREKSKMKSKMLQSWYNWFLGPDVIENLLKHRGLPLSLNIDTMMKTIL